MISIIILLITLLAIIPSTLATPLVKAALHLRLEALLHLLRKAHLLLAHVLLAHVLLHGLVHPLLKVEASSSLLLCISLWYVVDVAESLVEHHIHILHGLLGSEGLRLGLGSLLEELLSRVGSIRGDLVEELLDRLLSVLLRVESSLVWVDLLGAPREEAVGRLVAVAPWRHVEGLGGGRDLRRGGFFGRGFLLQLQL